MVLTATLTPDGISGLVDVYVMVRLPDLSLLSLQPGGGIAPGAVPFTTGLAPFPLSGRLFEFPIPPGLPAQTFTWIGQLTHAGTGVVIGVPDEVPFTFTQ